MTSNRILALAAAAAAALPGCANGLSSLDVDFDVSIEGRQAGLVIDYTLTNTSDDTLVAYHRVGGLDDGGDVTYDDVNRVYIYRDDDQVEIAKKIDHPCHEDPDFADDACEIGSDPVTWRIGGTTLAPGEQLQERFEVPLGIEVTSGKPIRFCLGVAIVDEDNPTTVDGLYPPTRPQAVLCSDQEVVYR